MKIALIHNSNTYWLAGQPGVSERKHSSAGDLEFSGAIALQGQDRVRAVSRAWRDRGNYSAAVNFSTTRKFDSLTEAEEFAATYDVVYPRAGYLEFYGAEDALVATLLNAVVNPPRRRVTGVSVRLDYSVVGAIWQQVPHYFLSWNGLAITFNGSSITYNSLT
jgi:hypothetical protein